MKRETVRGVVVIAAGKVTGLLPVFQILKPVITRQQISIFADLLKCIDL